MVDVVDLDSRRARARPSAGSGNGTVSDADLIRAVEALADVYEHGGREHHEDCVRLTMAQARQLAAAARRGV